MFHLIGISTDYDDNWIKHYSIDDKPIIERYLYSLYWSTVTLLTVGYGDIVPQNAIEITFTLITVLCGCIVFGYNLNKIASIFQEMNKEKKNIQEKMDKINKFMEVKRINPDVQMRIQAYIKFVHEHQSQQLNKELLEIFDSLSEPLKEELYLQSYGETLRNYSLFADNFSESFLQSLVHHIKEEDYMTNEIIFKENDHDNHNLYFVISGKIQIFHLLNENQNPIVLSKKKKKTLLENMHLSEASITNILQKLQITLKFLKFLVTNLLKFLKSFLKILKNSAN